MDEIEWIKQTKKAILFIGKFVLGFVLFFEVMSIISYFTTQDAEYAKFVALLFLAIGIGIILFEIVMFLILHFIYKVIYSSGKIEKNKEEYIREIPKNYPPALVSLAYDLKIDVYKDYTATLLNLYIKKYINIINYSNTTHIISGTNNKLENLQTHEKYVYDCLISKNRLDENKFKTFIIQDAQQLGIITNKKESKLLKISLLILCTILLICISYFINKLMFYTILGISLSLLLTYYMLLKASILTITDTNYKRTSIGKSEAKKLSAIKQFIKEYTLIAEKDLNYIEILDEYIPYAISLDEATNIEKYIINNENYRNLIYNK